MTNTKFTAGESTAGIFGQTIIKHSIRKVHKLDWEEYVFADFIYKYYNKHNKPFLPVTSDEDVFYANTGLRSFDLDLTYLLNERMIAFSPVGHVNDAKSGYLPGLKWIELFEAKDPKQLFENFRQEYPGKKRGLDTEYNNFIDKNKKSYKILVALLLSAIRKQIRYREWKVKQGQWVPEWKNLQTWINQRCWEEEYPDVEQIESKSTDHGDYEQVID